MVDGTGQVRELLRVPTPKSADALDDSLDQAVRTLAARHSIAAVGLAVAGFVSDDRSTVRFAPHLPWLDAPVGVELSARLGLPVILEHDANAALVGEHRFGAAAGGRVVALIAIGTGIGAALLIDGTLYRGAHGIAPELGHLQVVPDGRACPCGKRGCWERYCSGTALARTAGQLLAAEPGGSRTLAHAAADPDSLTGRLVAAAARDGDPIAVAAMRDLAGWLGLGLAGVADMYDPDLVVIGGGVSASAPLFLDDARERYAAALTGAGHRPLARIRAAQLGDAAGMIGAAELARAAHTDG
ncbi:ROK family protein [Skermania piniformis]